jgi:hypothetical protein
MRDVPEHFEDKRKHWVKLSKFWFFRSNSLGIAVTVLYFSTAALGGLAPWPQLGWRLLAIGLPIAAGVVAYLISTFAAQAKGTAYEVASREIEEAEALYRADPTLSEKHLAEAEARGIRILNAFKLN